MKNFKLLLLLSILGILPVTVNAQEYFQAPGLTGVNGNPYYILPKATLLFQIPVGTTTQKAGELAKKNKHWENHQVEIKKRFSVDLDVLNSLKDKESIVKSSIDEDSLKVTMLAKPDFSRIFYTDGLKKWNKNKSVTFTYGADGVLTEGESSVEDKTLDLVLKGISSITSIAAVAFKGGDTKPVDADPFLPLQDILDKIANLHLKTSDKDIYKEVKTAYEKEYAKLFAEYFYSEKRKIKTYKVQYTPVKLKKEEENTAIDFFAIDPATGALLFNTGLSKQLWGSELKVGTLSDTSKPYKIKFISVTENLVNHLDGAKMPSNGFAYNIPLRMEFVLMNKEQKFLYDDILKFPQFGQVGRIYSAKNKLTFGLDPLSGELKKLSVSSSALTTDQVSAVGTTAGDAIKTIQGDDAATALEKEVKRLENEKKKRDLLKELNQ